MARPASSRSPLEVHEHCIISGPRAHKSWCNKIVHSHEGGDAPHQHPDTGPAAYTIDKDEWFWATGLKGGGRKKFTAKPNGEQLQFVARDPSQQSFAVVVGPPPAEYKGEGPGIAPIVRMQLAMHMTVSSVTKAEAR